MSRQVQSYNNNYNLYHFVLKQKTKQICCNRLPLGGTKHVLPLGLEPKKGRKEAGILKKNLYHLCSNWIWNLALTLFFMFKPVQHKRPSHYKSLLLFIKALLALANKINSHIHGIFENYNDNCQIKQVVAVYAVHPTYTLHYAAVYTPYFSGIRNRREQFPKGKEKGKSYALYRPLAVPPNPTQDKTGF